MTATANDATSNCSISSTTRVRIAELERSREHVFHRHIEASVALVWPYSSSTRRFALLLSETDSRSLSSRRQVKVTFYNGAAKAAQETRIGIGDDIKLELDGCSWEAGQDQISTPGKRLEQDIEFRRLLRLKVNPGTSSEKAVNYLWDAESSPEAVPAPGPFVTHALNDEMTPSKTVVTFETPKSKKSFRLSGSFVEASLDPFSEDKDYVYGRNRKRTKFARSSGAWRLVGDDDDLQDAALPSPTASPLRHYDQQKQMLETALQQSHLTPETIDLTSPAEDVPKFPPDHIEAFRHSQPEIGNDEQASMPPPTTLFSRDHRHLDLPNIGFDETRTPRLHPLASPGLPLVSPLLSRIGANSDFFRASAIGVDASKADYETAGKEPISDESSMVAGRPAWGIDAIHQDPETDSPIQLAPARLSDVVEDEDMYNAPASVAPLQDASAAPAKDATNALNVLEELFNMSPATHLGIQEDAAEASLSPQSQEIGRSDEETSTTGSLNGANYQIPMQQEIISADDEKAKPSSSFERNSPVEVYEIESRAEIVSIASLSQSDTQPLIDQASEQSFVIQAGPQQSNMSEEMLALRRREAAEEERLSPQPPEHAGRDHERLHDYVLPTPEQTQEPAQVTAKSETNFRHLDNVLHMPTPDPTQVDIPLPSPSSTMSQHENILDVANDKQILEPVRYSGEIVNPSQTNAVDVHSSTESSTPITDMSTQKSHRTSTLIVQGPDDSDDISNLQVATDEPLPTASSNASDAQTNMTVQKSSLASDQLSSPLQSKRRMASENDETVGSGFLQLERLKPSKTIQHQITGLTTPVAYYAALARLHECFNQNVDTIAICVEDSTSPKRSNSGPKDWYTTLQVVDLSSDGSAESLRAVQIFRHNKDALPFLRRGNAIMLRDFKVQTRNHVCFLLSTESSAWAVFKASPDGRSIVDEAIITGPPLEHGRHEIAYMKRLADWWGNEGQELYQERRGQPLRKLSETAPQTDSNPLSAQSDPIASDGVGGMEPALRTARKQPSPATDNIGFIEADVIAEHRPEVASKLPKGRRPPTIDTESYSISEKTVTSIEQPLKSPIRTRRHQKLASEAKADSLDNTMEQENGKKHKAPSMTPTRRQPPRRTKTPSANLNGNPTPSETSPDPYAAQHSALAETARRTRATKSPREGYEVTGGPGHYGGSYRNPSVVDDASPVESATPKPRRSSIRNKSPTTVHELRDGTKYVDNEDGNGRKKDKNAVHELRDGRRWVDEE